jgi:peptidoglycan/LPS O-acetylase OafA/YrhL
MQQSSYIKSLDGLRFLAVSLVLVDHWSDYRMGFPGSYLGVSLFFVLSGYLITGILLKAKAADNEANRAHGKSLKLFYIRRTIRIFPIYYLILIVLFLINYDQIRQHIWWLASYQSNNYIALKSSWMGAYDHFWSLAVEEQFYIFFPFVIFFTSNKWLSKVLISLCTISVLLRLYFFLNHYNWVVPFVLMPTSLDALGLGSLLAYFLQNTNKNFPNNYIKLGLGLSFLSYCFVIFLIKADDKDHNFYTVVILRFFEAIFSVFLIFSFVKNNDNILIAKLKRIVFENDFVVFIGKISYGIYIYHHFIYNVYYTSDANFISKIFQKLNSLSPNLGDNPIVQIAILFPITILVATVSWYLFEKPINKLKDRFEY